MIADLKPYAEYKASSQAWLGAVPQHWSVVPNRALFAEVKDRNHPDEEMLSVTITRGIVRQKALLAGSSKKDSSNLDKSAYKLVQPRDIAYNKMRTWQGAIGASTLRGIISPAYVVMRLRRDDDLPRYFHHLYRTPQFAKEAERWSYGITSDMWSLRPEHFKMIYTPEPPPDEQAAIVRFLDWANGRLEWAIRAKRKVIALLNEQKQAIIHRAVIRGLDPSVPLKPSGIPWLGDIPQHWEVQRLKSLLACRLTNGVFKRGDAFGSGVPLVNVADIYAPDGRIRPESLEKVHATPDEVETFRVLAGDLFFVRSSLKLEGTGRCAFAESLDADTVFECHVVRARPDRRRIVTRFLAMFLSSWAGVNNTVSRANTVTMSTLGQGAINSLPVVVPPLSEQRGILGLVDAESSPLTAAISRLAREIELLREYRTRLVADVVTGKLDVREAAKQLPEETGKPEASIDSDEPGDEIEFEPALSEAI